MNDFNQRIFLSYRRDGGKEVAMLLHSDLRRRGYKNVFLDLYNLKVGFFKDTIDREIENCDCFILILTSGSLDRCGDSEDPVAHEIRLAQKSKCNIVPISVDNAYKTSWPCLPSDIDTIHNIQFSDLVTNSLFESSVDLICKDRLLSSKPSTPRRTDYSTKTKLFFGGCYALISIMAIWCIVYLFWWNPTFSGYRCRVATTLFCIINLGIVFWGVRKIKGHSSIGVACILSDLLAISFVGYHIHRFLSLHTGFDVVLKKTFYPSMAVVYVVSTLVVITYCAFPKYRAKDRTLLTGIKELPKDVLFWVLLLCVLGWGVYCFLFLI